MGVSQNKSVEGVLIELRQGIQRGRYVPGQRLITSELAQKLGISLAPVREALHILAGEGIVELQPNKGARVRTLTRQTFIDGLQVLEAIGRLAFRLLAQRTIDAEARVQISDCLKNIREAGHRRNASDFFDAVATSHRLANDLSGNSYLNPILNRIHLEYFYRQMIEYLPDTYWSQYVKNYEGMGTALERGDVESAEGVWTRHIDWLITMIGRHAEAQ